MNTGEFARRRDALMQQVGDDAIVIVAAGPHRIRYRDVHYPYRPDSDLRYLTGFPEPEAVLVLIPGRKEGQCLLFCRDRDPDREIWDGLRAGPEGACRDYAADQAFPVAEMDERMPDLLAGRSTVYLSLASRDGVQHQIMQWLDQLKQQQRRGTAAPSRVEDLDVLLHEMRLHKSEAEVAAMQRAADISAQAHIRAMQRCTPGMHEYEIAAELGYEFARHGMTEAYGSIVAGGANACILHYVENRAVLNDGDLLLIDAGAEHDGYCADITRTFPVNGRYSKPQREVYEIVLAAQQSAIDTVQPGNDWNAPHRAAVQVITQGLVDLKLLEGDVDGLIESEAYKRYYMHSTGHWLGMDVHDVGGYKRDGEWRALAPGMALTVEPGIYISAAEDVPGQLHGIGIRIEDDVLVTEQGNHVLTAAAPKAADEIEQTMRQ